MARLLLIILVTFVSFVAANNNDEESDHIEQLQSGVRSVRHGERSRRETLYEANTQEKKRRRPLRRRKSKKSKEKEEQTKEGKGEVGRKSPKQSRKVRKLKKKKSKHPKKNDGNKAENNGRNKNNERKDLAKQAESKPITKECLTNILTAIKLRTKGTNYKKQADRITKFEKTGKNKLSKKAQFSSVAEKLVDVGGGNKDELKCGSEGSSGAGAKSLKDAITQLEACDAELKTKCNTSSYSIPPNSAEVEKCKTNFAEINKVLSECDKLNPNSTSADKLCECFSGNGGDAAKWKQMLTEAKACKVLKTFNDKTTASHKECTKAFKKCTSTKKEAPKLFFSCSQTTEALKKKAAAAKKNADAVKKAKEKSAKLAGSSRQSRDISTPASCADVIKTNTELSKEAGKGKTNTKVAALGKAIAATPDSVTCSTEEKSSLKEQVTLLDAIATAIEAFVSELKEAIKTATGSEPTDSELDNVETSTTKKAVLRRDKIVKDLLARM